MRFIVERFFAQFLFYGIILFGTSTPPARGGELAHDGYNT